jgi:hypothetical protein
MLLIAVVPRQMSRLGKVGVVVEGRHNESSSRGKRCSLPSSRGKRRDLVRWGLLSKGHHNELLSRGKHRDVGSRGLLSKGRHNESLPLGEHGSLSCRQGIHQRSRSQLGGSSCWGSRSQSRSQSRLRSRSQEDRGGGGGCHHHHHHCSSSSHRFGGPAQRGSVRRGSRSQLRS